MANVLKRGNRLAGEVVLCSCHRKWTAHVHVMYSQASARSVAWVLVKMFTKSVNLNVSKCWQPWVRGSGR